VTTARGACITWALGRPWVFDLAQKRWTYPGKIQDMACGAYDAYAINRRRTS
jgi:hypothetical protein